MQISENKIDDLNAVLTVNVTKDDFQQRWDNALKSYRKQMSLPGFRPGMVPMGMVKKRFGRSLLAEEMNKIVSESLFKHIEDNKLNILGQPLPKESEEDAGDWDNPSEFSFDYEIGLAPTIAVDLSKKNKFTNYVVSIDDKIIDDEVNDITRRFGSISNPSTSEAGDMIEASAVELVEGSKDEVKPGGLFKENITVFSEAATSDKTKKQLVGLREGDVIVVDPESLSEKHADIEKMFSISHEEVHNLSDAVQLTVSAVKRLTPSEVNQELFDKAFGEGAVANEEEFRAKIAEGVGGYLKGNTDQIFVRDVQKALVEKLNPTLPDEFLKRWIRVANEKPLTAEQIEADYENYSKSLKWQLIENSIVRDNDLKVEYDEIMAETKKGLAAQYAQYGMPLEEEMLESFAKNQLQNQDEVRKITEALYRGKVVEVIKEKAKIEDKEVNFEEYLKLLQG